MPKFPADCDRELRPLQRPPLTTAERNWLIASLEALATQHQRLVEDLIIRLHPGRKAGDDAA
jgi:hypothetical protein